jgi:hypothetical protein
MTCHKEKLTSQANLFLLQTAIKIVFSANRFLLTYAAICYLTTNFTKEETSMQDQCFSITKVICIRMAMFLKWTGILVIRGFNDFISFRHTVRDYFTFVKDPAV